MHQEKSFVELTKIWLAQQKFSFKNGTMEILFELIKKILLIFIAIPTTTTTKMLRQQKKWNSK